MPPGNPHWRLPWQQNWLPLPICLFAPIGIMWVFVILKGLLRSLGIRLRDHIWNNYSARSSSSLALPFLSQQRVSAGIYITRGKATHCPTGVCADWEKPIKSFICVTLKRQRNFSGFGLNDWTPWMQQMSLLLVSVRLPLKEHVPLMVLTFIYDLKSYIRLNDVYVFHDSPSVFQEGLWGSQCLCHVLGIPPVY